MSFIRHYLLAVQFFTRIPVTGRLADWVGFSPAMLRASAGHFPGVGVLVGAVAAAVYGVLAMMLPDTTFAPLIAPSCQPLLPFCSQAAFMKTDWLTWLTAWVAAMTKRGRWRS